MTKLTNNIKLDEELTLTFAQGALEAFTSSAVSMLVAIACKGWGMNNTLAAIIGGAAGMATICATEWVIDNTTVLVVKQEAEFWANKTPNVNVK